MLRIITALAASLTMSLAVASGGELDNEKAITNEQITYSYDLPATVVVRVNADGSEAGVLQSKEALPAGIPVDSALNQLKGEFLQVDGDAKVPMNELDQDSSKSSWYLYFYNRVNWYPCYYYNNYRYYYAPYWSYYHSGYWYYYYRWVW